MIWKYFDDFTLMIWKYFDDFTLMIWKYFDDFAPHWYFAKKLLLKQTEIIWKTSLKTNENYMKDFSSYNRKLYQGPFFIYKHPSKSPSPHNNNLQMILLLTIIIFE
jgi:hypothetical protein